MSPPLVVVTPEIASALHGAEAILESLEYPDLARAELEKHATLDETALGDNPHSWLARVSVDDTDLLVRADGHSWAILAPGESDASDTALAARKLHGLIGAFAEGWDLDR